MALEWVVPVPVPATWNSTDGTGDSDDVDGCYEDSSGWPQEAEEAVLPLLVLLLSLLVMSAHVHHHHRLMRRRLLTTDSLDTTITTKVTSL